LGEILFDGKEIKWRGREVEVIEHWKPTGLLGEKSGNTVLVQEEGGDTVEEEEGRYGRDELWGGR
jgi:hypothetical protein